MAITSTYDPNIYNTSSSVQATYAGQPINPNAVLPNTLLGGTGIAPTQIYKEPMIKCYAEEKIKDDDLSSDIFKQLQEDIKNNWHNYGSPTINNTQLKRIPPKTLKRLKKKILAQIENYITIQVINDKFDPDKIKVTASINIPS